VATLSVKTIVNNCLGKAGPLSVKRDVLGVYGNDNPQTRSLRERLELIENKPFVRVALVTINGATTNPQRDLDNGNLVYQQECDAWVYCVGSITVDRPHLQMLDQTDCLATGHVVSEEEDELFDLGRDLGADIVGYYIRAATSGARGCAAHPPGRRGFWVGDTATQWTLIHETTHVVGDNPHETDTDNLMLNNTGNITNPPPDLTSSQCERINNDPAIESC
jgi:hypothetical protein